LLVVAAAEAATFNLDQVLDNKMKERSPH